MTKNMKISNIILLPLGEKKIMSLCIDMQNVIVLHEVKAWLEGLVHFLEIAP